MIRLDPLDLPALRKTYNKHIFDPSKPPLGNWKKRICQYSKLKEKKGVGGKEDTFLLLCGSRIKKVNENRQLNLLSLVGEPQCIYFGSKKRLV